MNCDCIDFITKELTDRGYVGVSIVNRAWMLDGGGTEMYGTFEHEIEIKNGKKRKKEMNLSFSYCPFCGVKYKRAQKADEE